MSNGDWSLEVVRGREVGRLYALAPGVSVLGNALRGASGLDLAEQEGNDYRRMDGRQAQLDCSPQGLVLRDLDSTNGTFLNRQRLLAGQARPLHPGDVIQLAGVQLKVVAGAPTRPATPPQPTPAQPPPSPAPAAPGAFRFTTATGDECRSWDDFLTIASRRWPALREELISGRLARFVATVQRPDLTPITAGTPDDRLDAWLGVLPTTRPSGPIMDIQPRSLVFRVVPGVGVSRQSVRVANSGNRLLYSTVRIEPEGASWVRLLPEFTGGPFVTVDATELPIEVHFPKVIDRTLTAALVIESNGGLRQVEVRLERPPLPAGMPIPEPEPEPIVSGGIGLGAMVARQPLWLRVAGSAVLGVLLRLLVLAGGLVLPGEPLSLRGAALVFGLIGGSAAAVFALRKGAWTDLPTAGFAGGFAGVLAAAVVVAGCRALETPWAARLSTFPYAGLVLWAVLGTALAGVSARLVPHRPTTEHTP